MAFADLGPRVKTAIVMVGIFCLLLVAAGFSCWGRGLLLICALILVLGCHVELSLFCTKRSPTSVRLGYILCGCFAPITVFCSLLPGICAVLPLPDIQRILSLASIGLGLAVAYAILQGRNNLEELNSVFRDLLPGMLLTSFGGSLLISLAGEANAASTVLWLALVVCSNDIAAYFAGKSIGGPKIAPAISPNKTYAGCAGGLIVGALIGTLLGRLCLIGQAWGQVFAVSTVVVLAAQSGDFLKSALKRIHLVKDSGTLLPGHGGLLDRLDGILAGAAFLQLVRTFF